MNAEQSPQQPESNEQPVSADAVAAGPGDSGHPVQERPEAPRHFDFRKLFWGPNGLRAGWRLLIFFAFMFVLGSSVRWIFRRVLHHSISVQSLTPGLMLGNEWLLVALALLAGLIMARLEGRNLADYGLPARGAFGRRFLEGFAWGFLFECVTMGILFGTGNLSFSGLAQHGLPALRFGLVWAVAFIGTGMFEEFTFRGYAQFTLSTGIGFWPAAFLLSGLFWLAHMGNPGETWIGGLGTALAALAFCVVLRRTGNLWFPIGMHAGWDWTETYFFGVPDSGMQAHGYLLNTAFHGSKWVTGGTVGPEGSVVGLLVLALVILLLCWRFATTPESVKRSGVKIAA